MKTVFMVAEKPSLAASLAKILSSDNFVSKKLHSACSIHEYNGKFKGETVRFRFTSVCGHVMSLDFPGQFNNWDKVDPADLFRAPTTKKEATPSLSMPKFLESQGSRCDYLVLWLDCDKEGENICYEVIDCIRPVMNRPPSGNPDDNIYRAKFSAITEKEVREAMATLARPDLNQSLSVDARQELDLRVGCAFTRFQTKFFQNKYGDLDSTLISYGPCQTPTLGFCVDRLDKINSFKPEKFWVLELVVQKPDNSGALSLDWSRVRVFDQEVATLFLNKVKSAQAAHVTRAGVKQAKKQRPQALNTVELLRAASSGLGIGPQQTMQIAERLYTQGYISYPRTETTHYPDSFDLKAALRPQAESREWGTIVSQLLAGDMQKPRKGQDAGDHPPITPMRLAYESDLGHDMWRIYDYITRHFIATLCADCVYNVSSAELSAAGEVFSVCGKQLVSPGYTAVMTWQALADEEAMPQLCVGDKLDISDTRLVTRMTSPPDLLTESELISLMEKNGIGTDASIPTHINNICERNYVQLQSGRRLLPTNLGIVLVHGYRKIDSDLVLSSMRMAIEQQLNLIALGKANYNEVLDWTISTFSQKFRYFVENISAMDELFEVSFSSLADSGKPMSRCGKCRRYMKFIQTRPPRLHCATCNDTYSLPSGGNVRLYRELRCPLDDFELLQWSSGPKGKSYPFCPYCMNKPPFRDMKKGFGCDQCTHPTCEHSLSSLGVAACRECEQGTYVLDLSSAPKWKMVCNRCSSLVLFFKKASKVSVLRGECSECNESKLLQVSYANAEDSPLEGGVVQYSGCPFCDPVLEPHTNMLQVKVSLPSRRGGRGRGRGRGRGDRGGRGRR